MPIEDILYFLLLTGSYLVCVFRARYLYSIKRIRHLFAILIVVQGFAEVLNLSDVNNLFLYHILTPIETILLIGIFCENIKSGTIIKVLRGALYIIPMVCILFAYQGGIKNNNSFAVTMEAVLLITLSLIGLKELMLDLQPHLIREMPFFWFCVAVLFYCVGNLLVLGFLDYLISYDLKIAKVMYKSTYVFSYQFFVLIAIASFASEKQFLK